MYLVACISNNTINSILKKYYLGKPDLLVVIVYLVLFPSFSLVSVCHLLLLLLMHYNAVIYLP